MKILNKTGNTLFAEDVNLHIPYTNEPETLTPDILKKSRILRNIIINRVVDVVEYDDKERIENSIMYMRSMSPVSIASAPKPAEPQATFVSDLPKTELRASTGIDVKIHGIFYDAGGYAKVNRNFALALHKLGVNVKVDPKKSVNELKADELQTIAKLEKTQINRNHICIDSVVPTFAEASSGKYKVLYTTVESYTVPKQFLECCKLYNEIWVTSPFAAEILSQEVKDIPIYVVPAGVDHKLYTPEGPAFDLNPKLTHFVFISVFGWGYRKGYDVLLRSYFDEFSGDDKVSLLIMSRYQSGTTKYHKQKIKDDIDKIMAEFPNKHLPQVVRFSQVLPEEDMPKLYRAANCFILTSRGESSCLPPVEASLCGLPVIMTNVSGQTMYLRSDNAYLIEMDRLVEIQKGQMHVHFWDGQKFPDLTSDAVKEQTKKAMRTVYESYFNDNYREPLQKCQRMQKLIKENFTWEHTAAAALARLEDIKTKL